MAKDDEVTGSPYGLGQEQFYASGFDPGVRPGVPRPGGRNPFAPPEPDTQPAADQGPWAAPPVPRTGPGTGSAAASAPPASWPPVAPGAGGPAAPPIPIPGGGYQGEYGVVPTAPGTVGEPAMWPADPAHLHSGTINHYPVPPGAASSSSAPAYPAAPAAGRDPWAAPSTSSSGPAIPPAGGGPWAAPQPPHRSPGQKPAGMNLRTVILGGGLVMLLVVVAMVVPRMFTGGGGTVTPSFSPVPSPTGPPGSAPNYPVATPIGTSPLTYAGAGNAMLDLASIGPDGAWMVTVSNDQYLTVKHVQPSGYDYFLANFPDAGTDQRALINDFGLPQWISIETKGSWNVRIEPATQAPVWDSTQPLTGTGQQVYRVDPPVTGGTVVNGTYVGESNFIVGYCDAECTYPRLLFNEIADWTGSDQLDEDAAYLQIEYGSGTYTIEVK